jgi:sorbitol-6-phosphate 2-dehydrogenase
VGTVVHRGRGEGKIAIIVGASRGIGEGTARDFAKEGARVVLVCSRTIDRAQKIAEEINQKYGPGRAAPIQADVTKEEDVIRMIDETVNVFGEIDIVVYSAGALRAGSVKTMSLQDFELVTKVNYVGYFLCVKHAAKVMAEQHKRDPSRWMDIIQINSKSGLQGSYRNAAYAGSKFGGIGLTQSFALELLEDGIKVNAICPGNYFDGPLWSDPNRGLFVQYLKAGKVPRAKTVEDVKRYYESKIPMGKGCQIEDIMHAIYYVIEQPYETGQAILVAGGQLMR